MLGNTVAFMIKAPPVTKSLRNPEHHHNLTSSLPHYQHFLKNVIKNVFITFLIYFKSNKQTLAAT